MKTYYTLDEIVKKVQDAVEKAGTQTALARQLDIGNPYLSEICRGTRRPGPKVLRLFDMEAVTVYRKVGKDANN